MEPKITLLIKDVAFKIALLKFKTNSNPARSVTLSITISTSKLVPLLTVSELSMPALSGSKSIDNDAALTLLAVMHNKRRISFKMGSCFIFFALIFVII